MNNMNNMNLRDILRVLFSPYVVWLPFIFPRTTAVLLVAFGVFIGWWFL